MQKMKSIFYFSIILVACNFSKKCTRNSGAMNNLKKIVFCFEDSSVPPEYHRSYCIMVTSDKIHLTVDSYGNVLTDTIIPNQQEYFEHLCQIFPSFGIEKQKETHAEGCVGGTSERLSLYDQNDAVILSGYIYYCGGKKFGNLKGDLQGFGREIKKLIPNFTSLLKIQ